MWSADMYGKFEKERKQPSIDLLNKIDGGKFERIIDIGCGSGMTFLKWKLMLKGKHKLTSDELGMLASYNMPVDFTRRENIKEIIAYVNS